MKTFQSSLPSLLISIHVIGILLLAGALNAEDAGQKLLVHEDLVYSKSDKTLTLDLFVPKTVEGSIPCVMVIQGGGFIAQDGQKFKPFAVYLAEHGFAAALIA